MKNGVHTASREHGSAYVVVLMISMLVTIIGVAALSATRVQLRAATMLADSEDAALAARCGIELAQYYTLANSNWRTTRGSGVWSSSIPLNSCTTTISVIDVVDSDITNSPFDAIQVTAVARKGKVCQQLQAVLSPTITPLTCMQTSVSAGGTITLNGSTDWICNAPVASGTSVTAASGADVDTDVEAVGTVTGTGIIGSKTSGAIARTMPDPTTVFDYYKRRGTVISYGSTNGNIEKCLISPSNNPYGATNAEGIYVIDCGGSTIKIDRCRIYGTLVLLNVKSDSSVEKQVNLQPVTAGYPALMVQGSVTMKFDASTLKESDVSTNLNPVGSPYNGVSNATQSDTYPSMINGPVYLTGNLTLSNDKAITGPIVVGGTITADDALTTTWAASSSTIAPAPGFTATPVMKPLGTSWKKLVN